MRTLQQVMRHKIEQQSHDESARLICDSEVVRSPVEGSGFACPKNEAPQRHEGARV